MNITNLRKNLHKRNHKDIQFIYEYMLYKKSHGLTKNQMIHIILQPLRIYSMEEGFEIEMKEIPKKYQLTYYCATCCPQNKVVYKKEFKYLTHEEYLEAIKQSETPDGRKKILQLLGNNNYCRKCASQFMYMDISEVNKSKPKYKMEKDKEKKIKDRLLPFKFALGQTVEFLNSKSFTGHIGIKITKSGKNPKNPKQRLRPDQSITFGFYPKDGNMAKSLICEQDGEIWTPDPYLKKGNYRKFFTGKLSKENAKTLNDIIDKNCELHEGTTGIRLKCSTTDSYKIIPVFGNQYNCRSYVTKLFPNYKNEIKSLLLDLIK